MPAARRRPPLVLIINDQEWSTRSLESILAPNGFSILRAYTGRKGLERARSARPDMIVIDLNLPDMDGLELCEALRDDPETSVATPVVVTAAGHPTRQQRLAALRAGAWDFLGQPMDAEEILLRFDTYARAKLGADEARDEGLLDQLTGLYNLQGLARRARELGSQAFREHAPLACIVIAPELVESTNGDGDGAAADEAARHLAETLKAMGRVSDAIGRVGRSEFAVFAPGADEAGVERLAARISEALEQRGSLRIRAGFDAVADFREATIEPVDLLVRASSALRRARRDSRDKHPAPTEWIRRFDTQVGLS